MPSLVRIAALVALASACNRGKTALGGGTAKDARLISSVYTWECVNNNDGALYQGAFSQDVRLEFAPDALRSFEMPAEGDCATGLDLIPTDAGDGGQALPELEDEPRWTTDIASGELSDLGAGFYYDSVLENVHSCQEVNQILDGGTTLSEAGLLDGVATPEPAAMPEVALSGDYESGIPWGTELEATWDAEHAWDSVWVQVRRERDGEAWESVTCNATGLDAFTIGDAVWAEMTESLTVDANNLYVGFERTKTRETADGLKVDAITRAMAVTVVQGG
jgi:hypothetical protein